MRRIYPGDPNIGPGLPRIVYNDKGVDIEHPILRDPALNTKFKRIVENLFFVGAKEKPENALTQLSQLKGQLEELQKQAANKDVHTINKVLKVLDFRTIKAFHDAAIGTIQNNPEAQAERTAKHFDKYQNMVIDTFSHLLVA